MANRLIQSLQEAVEYAKGNKTQDYETKIKVSEPFYLHILKNKIWEDKAIRERLEVEEFIKLEEARGGRKLSIIHKSERPDYTLHDLLGNLVGIELTTPYKDDDSVPERHKKKESIHIEDSPINKRKFLNTVAKKIRGKLESANNPILGYTKYPNLMLFVYLNEYEMMCLKEKDIWLEWAKENRGIFLNIKPFTEIIFGKNKHSIFFTFSNTGQYEWRQSLSKDPEYGEIV